MNELAKVEQNKGAIMTFTPDRLQLLKDTICKDTTDDEFRLFLYACERTGLDPFLKQLHAVKRWDSNLGRKVMTIQTGIDGYRLMADRTKAYAGNDDATFVEGENGPKSATVTVYKIVNGVRYGFSATARWSEYCQKTKDGNVTKFWRDMPYGQLAKCAEALALRKAFPAELSGIYTDAEMDQAQNDVVQRVSPHDHDPEVVIENPQREEKLKQIAHDTTAKPGENAEHQAIETIQEYAPEEKDGVTFHIFRVRSNEQMRYFTKSEVLSNMVREFVGSASEAILHYRKTKKRYDRLIVKVEEAATAKPAEPAKETA